jgi:hypothetical protein
MLTQKIGFKGVARPGHFAIMGAAGQASQELGAINHLLRMRPDSQELFVLLRVFLCNSAIRLAEWNAFGGHQLIGF